MSDGALYVATFVLGFLAGGFTLIGVSALMGTRPPSPIRLSAGPPPPAPLPPLPAPVHAYTVAELEGGPSGTHANMGGALLEAFFEGTPYASDAWEDDPSDPYAYGAYGDIPPLHALEGDSVQAAIHEIIRRRRLT